MKHYGYQSGVFDLNHGWRFIEEDFSVLPLACGHNDIYNYSKAGGMKGPAQPSFNDLEWKEVSLPHDWVTHHDFDENEIMNCGYKSRGIGWYRNRFSLDEEDKNRQILLEFEGMSCDAQIFVNGQLVYRNFSGYQGFCVDITDMANFGAVPNVLAVRIDATAWEGWWYEGAGIYRPVWLVKKPPSHIAYQGQWVNPCKNGDDSWSVEIHTELENSLSVSQNVQMYTEILDSNEEVLATQTTRIYLKEFSKETMKSSMTVSNPDLWSPEAPVLYRCRTTLTNAENGGSQEVDRDFLTTEFGFRSIRMDPDTGFWLNGINRKIKGFCNHQDHAGVGAAVPYALKEYRIKKLKEIGADAYRCAHNTDPDIMEICDRLGMIVMEENRTFSTAEDNLERLKSLVKTARNHPSVCFYSVFNEEPLQGSAKGRRMAERMQAVIRQMDPTRLVLGAFNGGYMEEYGASGVLEVVGINYNQAMYDSFHKKYPHTPLIASETSSAFAVRGEYSTDSEKHIFSSYDEDYAAWGASARDTWKCVSERSFVAGSFVWTGFDYRGEPTPYDWPSVSTFFGVLDSCGFRKAPSYLYEAFYKSEPILHLEPHWNWEKSSQSNIKVAVMSNCETVTLYLNGRKVGEKEIPPYDMARFEIPFEPGKLRAEGYRNGNMVCMDQVNTAGKPEKLLLECSKEELEDNGMDVVVVNVYAVDEQGILVPDADNLVEFEVSDTAEILGVGNGNPNSHEPDCAYDRKLFHGCAQGIIKNCGKEELKIIVRSSGLKSAERIIKIKHVSSLPKVKNVDQQQIDGWKLYYKLFGQMPNPNPQISQNDMNTFEPISFEGQPQMQLSNQYGKYALFRAEYDFSTDTGAKALFFGNILGRAWVYINGIQIAYKDNPKEEHLLAPLKVNAGKAVITVVIQNQDEDWQQAGILAPVFMQRLLTH